LRCLATPSAPFQTFANSGASTSRGLDSPAMRFVVYAFIAFILFSLGSALFFLIRDKGQSTRTLKALAVRVALSITLFAILMLGYKFGFIPGRL
jgi:formate/nitrite transporter FocA (FNT family)